MRLSAWLYCKGYIKAAITVLVAVIVACGCQKQSDKSSQKTDGQALRLATSTTTVESGLLDRLIPVFEKKYGINVEILISGSGEALQKARDGFADVVLVHSREEEDKFVSEGYGINRKDVMYNDFIILGPPDDPIHLKEEKDALSAFKAISDKKALFISRGKNAGTHAREKSLWKLLDIKPSGQWYLSDSKDQLSMLRTASERKAYCLADRSSYLFNKGELNLVIVMEGDRKLFNPYGVIAVSPAKVAGVNFEAAMKFIDFITSVDGQEIICYYGKMKYNKGLFIPLSLKNYTCQ
ncbi:substrate-binding domain-containing protein [Candidatus Magnetominusculus dajiuhuensis]|uniref:substrate-binding domain-containing protein n=1 Tax=Candidatus Magnetominusculus dajiuhuensis TaxID=3137712 RepID=UPI003B436765